MGHYSLASPTSPSRHPSHSPLLFPVTPFLFLPLRAVVPPNYIISPGSLSDRETVYGIPRTHTGTDSDAAARAQAVFSSTDGSHCPSCYQSSASAFQNTFQGVQIMSLIEGESEAYSNVEHLAWSEA